MKRNC
jgi:hypothetical protein